MEFNENMILEKIKENIKEKIDKIEFLPFREACFYSFDGNGKMVRPLLLAAFYHMFGGKEERFIKFSTAIEMIHTYSLIHDDLPAMDNSDFRRGKKSSHKAFGEAYAILVGDALLSYAFEIVSDITPTACADCHSLIKCVHILSKCAGMHGMVLGQVLDIDFEQNQNKDFTIDTLYKLDLLKTGKLLEASTLIGANLSNADITQDLENLILNFVKPLGLMYQIVDDILDVISNETELGKPINQDENKLTYIKLLGLEEAKNKAFECFNDCNKNLDFIKQKLTKDNDFTQNQENAYNYIKQLVFDIYNKINK